MIMCEIYSEYAHITHSLSVFLVQTQGQVLIAIAVSVYLFIAVPYLEEPDLLQVFGHQYQDYMKTTGMFIPHLPHLGKKKES